MVCAECMHACTQMTRIWSERGKAILVILNFIEFISGGGGKGTAQCFDRRKIFQTWSSKCENLTLFKKTAFPFLSSCSHYLLTNISSLLLSNLFFQEAI